MLVSMKKYLQPGNSGNEKTYNKKGQKLASVQNVGLPVEIVIFKIKSFCVLGLTYRRWNVKNIA